MTVDAHNSMRYIIMVNNLRGIELYGSVHTSISSNSKNDTKELFIFSEEFIGQASIFSTLCRNKILESPIV